jgi:glucose-1-phosphatase
MKINLKGLKNIIFDLGGVILNIDANASVNAFRKIGLKENITDGKLTYSDEIFYKLQTGVVTPKEFRDRVRVILHNPILTSQQINEAWCAMIGDIPIVRVKTIQHLQENYKVFLFSNTNKIHIDYLEDTFYTKYGFPFASLFEKVFYSHVIHFAKPDMESFLKVINLSGIIPGETLFVDDIDENIKGASKAGLKTYWLKEGVDMASIFI